MIKNFKTFTAAVEFYHLSRELPLKGVLKDQLSRAALSIPLNLAEGRAKPTVKDQCRFFSIALGSAKECQALLFLAELRDTQAWESLDKTTAHIYRLIQNTGG